MTHARKLTTRLVLASFSVAGTCAASGALGVHQAAAAPPPLAISLTWSTTLNDAPCGVVEASPVALNAGGTSAVEVGDRQGVLYALNLADGSVVPGWGSGQGQTIGSGQGCNDPNPGGGHPAVGINGLEVPGSPPIDSTASIDNAHGGDLYFGGGNAASPIDGGYTRTRPEATKCGTRSSPTRPPTRCPTAASRHRSHWATAGRWWRGARSDR